MSSIFSQESAASRSDSSEPECELPLFARLNPTASASCDDTGQLSLFSTTCEPSPPKLLPTPSAVAYGSNQGGGMGRVGPVRPSLQTMAKHGLWPMPSVKGNHNKAGLSPKSGNGLATAISMSFAEVFPVRILASPARAQALRD